METAVFLRLADANLDRISEGLRTVEDYFRFVCPHEEVAKRLKALRQGVRRSAGDALRRSTRFEAFAENILAFRDAAGDFGPNMSDALKSEGHYAPAYATDREMVSANFKRVQEGLRSLEEATRCEGMVEWSRFFERSRYESYHLEKEVVSILSRCALDLDERLVGLYGMTAARPDKGLTHVRMGEILISAGVRVLQYRDKDADARQALESCRILAEKCRAAGVWFIVNDRPDIALLSGADGVHLGQEDLPIKEVRDMVSRYLGASSRRFVIGVSTHNIEQVEQAVREGADYIGVGPIFQTRTKPNINDSVVGTALFAEAKRRFDIPMVCIGGICPTNVSVLLDAGARCLAIIDAVVSADDIENAAAEIHKNILTRINL